MFDDWGVSGNYSFSTFFGSKFWQQMTGLETKNSLEVQVFSENLIDFLKHLQSGFMKKLCILLIKFFAFL